MLIDSLHTIFSDNKYADKIIEKSFKAHPKWGKRDRKFFAETLYDIVRQWRLLWFCIEKNQTLNKGDLWQIFGAYWFLNHNEVPDLPDFRSFDEQSILDKFEEAKTQMKIVESYPDWLDDYMRNELGAIWDKSAPILNEKALVVLRVNRLKTNIQDLKKRLNSEDVFVEYAGPEYPDALILKERKNVFATKSFKDGLFEMQDGSSQLVAPFMKLEPGMRVVDACAGAGGKTLHIASLMSNKGKIIAMDVEEHKLAELKVRLRRAGVDTVETKHIDSNKVVKRLEGSFDRVLLDVPCSGMGVLKRNPDTKWKLTAERIEELKSIQQSILNDYSKMLKKGGYLIYATCSILPSENSLQVQRFLKNNPNFVLEEEKSIYPHETMFDGFYMARLLKN